MERNRRVDHGILQRGNGRLIEANLTSCLPGHTLTIEGKKWIKKNESIDSGVNPLKITSHLVLLLDWPPKLKFSHVNFPMWFDDQVSSKIRLG